MGCSASVLLLHALRSVGRANCGHMCSRQDRLSLDAAPPEDGYAAVDMPLTIIVMVTFCQAALCGERKRERERERHRVYVWCVRESAMFGRNINVSHMFLLLPPCCCALLCSALLGVMNEPGLGEGGGGRTWRRGEIGEEEWVKKGRRRLEKEEEEGGEGEGGGVGREDFWGGGGGQTGGMR